ncbi:MULTISPECIES: EamA family transporter [Caballeronia]|jgi:drug/metabolite transporter (DMT)-like permease|uniref:Multidrug DMT transporter permease n=1 Tax=Caballeronia zhejiangensis TaxID=871203 RepID=A0A656QSM1_9BURK|nr:MULTISPECIES: EamA family transporter [Caballeronia]EKS70802.1 putative 10 TMS drug/metabolite exporter, DME family, DMT superfamily protein [Burkholderia sp. SJ98]KDR33840.1 multidrug DMT transporter permease [Caballeronia zhejiangensis]MCG7405632.1 DMT family transporter [Caballeronia zhejiangensis]MCI1044765.1 EamA family transporter [Caballeronia zhejiangensis]MDR5766897.1 EamA family transporter [Caballeronia sp. LZ028]
MFTYTGGVVLLAAVLHASWNAMLHGNRDRFLSMTWMSIAIGAVSAIVVFYLPMPAKAAWPYIVASGLVHIVYNVSLVRSYRRGDLAQAYPIARGSSPMLVTLGAAIFAHEAIGPLHALGIVLISGGIIALALQGGRVSRAGVLAALTTGVTIAIYTVIDGIGVRLSDGEALTYTAWMFMFYWFMPMIFVAKRGPAALWTPVKRAPMAVGSSLAGGLVSIAAYGIVIWAMQSGAMGTVSALRETSVVFAALIGRVFLQEAVSARRWLACVVVAVGAVCLGL